MLRHLQHLLRDEEGQDLVEYALLAALIAIASVVSLSTLGPTISSMYESLIEPLQM